MLRTFHRRIDLDRPVAAHFRSPAAGVGVLGEEDTGFTTGALIAGILGGIAVGAVATYALGRSVGGAADDGASTLRTGYGEAIREPVRRLPAYPERSAYGAALAGTTYGVSPPSNDVYSDDAFRTYGPITPSMPSLAAPPTTEASTRRLPAPLTPQQKFERGYAMTRDEYKALG